MNKPISWCERRERMQADNEAYWQDRYYAELERKHWLGLHEDNKDSECPDCNVD